MNKIQGIKDNKINKVAGAVIVYNSQDKAILNIETYLNQVDIIYIIDNSDVLSNKLSKWSESKSNIRYLHNGCNKGVANALNQAAMQAIEDGFDYILTMDDDSSAPANMVSDMCKFLNNYVYPDKVGIVSVPHSKPVEGMSYKKVLYTMTSGNLLNLAAYKEVGPFDDKLFIDHVDHEYNLRLSISNYEVIEISNVGLNHRLGTNKAFKILGHRYQFISHSPERLYYSLRNGMYISKKYFFQKPLFCMKIICLVAKEVIKSLILEDDKKKRVSFSLKALLDASFDKMGRINY